MVSWYIPIILSLLLTVPGYMVIDHLTNNELTVIMGDLMDIVSAIIHNSPQIMAGVLQGLSYFASLMGFVIFHLHYIFILVEIFFISRCINIKDPVKMLEKFLVLNKDLVMFGVHLIEIFVNIFIRIGTMIGNYIPGT